MARSTVAKQVRDGALAWLARFGISATFLRFAVVGTLGFLWDTGTVYALREHTGIYVAGCAGFVVAASVNWAINRAWTFRGYAHDAAHRQWLRFMAANLVGFVVNRGVFFTLVASSAAIRAAPVWGSWQDLWPVCASIIFFQKS